MKSTSQPSAPRFCSPAQQTHVPRSHPALPERADKTEWASHDTWQKTASKIIDPLRRTASRDTRAPQLQQGAVCERRAEVRKRRRHLWGRAGAAAGAPG